MLFLQIGTDLNVKTAKPNCYAVFYSYMYIDEKY